METRRTHARSARIIAAIPRPAFVESHEHFGNLYSSPHRHQPDHGGDRVVRRARLSFAPGQRPSQHRLPDAERQRLAARCRSGDDGLVGRESARASVHDHRRARFDDLVEQQRQHQHHAAVRSQPRSRQRRGGRADRDRGGDAAAAAGHALGAVVPQVQPGRPGDAPALAELEDGRAFGDRRLRRDLDGADDFDGQRRRAGRDHGRAEVRGPRAGGSGEAAGPADRHQRDRLGAAELERQSPHRTAVLGAADVQHQGEWSVDERRRLSGR